MLLEDPFYDKDDRRIQDAALPVSSGVTRQWETAHSDVKYYFKAALYHFGRMLHGNSVGNLNIVSFEYDALVWSLYSVRDHLLQELNIFFRLDIGEQAVDYEQVKKKLKTKRKPVATGQRGEILKTLDELNDAKWFQSLQKRRHTITHRVSKPEVLVGGLSWDNGPPEIMLNRNSIEVYGKAYEEAMRRFRHEWLATSWLTIELFKKWVGSIWSAMSGAR